jgi:signal peptidase I
MAPFGKVGVNRRREYRHHEAGCSAVETDRTGADDVARVETSTPRPARTGRGQSSWLRDGLALVAFMVAVGAGRSSVADHYFVPTGSMIPTVEVGDRVMVNKLAYGLRLPFTSVNVLPFSGPRPGEVVVLQSPEQADVTLLKRVVAIPGDEVAVRNGLLYINGVRAPVARDASGLWEDLGTGAHRLRLTAGGGLDFGPVRVGPGEYLVMGDNRGESHDGRAFGLVERQAILGRALSVWMRDGGLTWKRL